MAVYFTRSRIICLSPNADRMGCERPRPWSTFNAHHGVYTLFPPILPIPLSSYDFTPYSPHIVSPCSRLEGSLPVCKVSGHLQALRKWLSQSQRAFVTVLVMVACVWMFTGGEWKSSENSPTSPPGRRYFCVQYNLCVRKELGVPLLTAFPSNGWRCVFEAELQMVFSPRLPQHCYPG